MANNARAQIIAIRIMRVDGGLGSSVAFRMAGCELVSTIARIQDYEASRIRDRERVPGELVDQYFPAPIQALATKLSSLSMISANPITIRICMAQRRVIDKLPVCPHL